MNGASGANGASIYIVIGLIALLVLWRRTRSMYRPIHGSGVRLLIPLVALIPALSLVFNPEVHEPAWEFAVAFGIGVLLSIPLIWTTHYEVREDNLIYARKNWGFIVAFVGIVLFRFLLRAEITDIEPMGKMALFMTVAIGYILPWRIVSYLKFRRVRARIDHTGTAA